MPRDPAPPSKGLDIGLWTVQGLLALTFVGTAIWKVATPRAELATKMPWMGEVSPAFFYATALFDLIVGLGVLLPWLTRIRPRLTPVAALGGVALMSGAVIFHLSRGEAASTPFNVFLAALCAFVAWGRRSP